MNVIAPNDKMIREGYVVVPDVLSGGRGSFAATILRRSMQAFGSGLVYAPCGATFLFHPGPAI